MASIANGCIQIQDNHLKRLHIIFIFHKMSLSVSQQLSENLEIKLHSVVITFINSLINTPPFEKKKNRHSRHNDTNILLVEWASHEVNLLERNPYRSNSKEKYKHMVKGNGRLCCLEFKTIIQTPINSLIKVIQIKTKCLQFIFFAT